jgi:hypothetical protein
VAFPFMANGAQKLFNYPPVTAPDVTPAAADAGGWRTGLN